MPKLPSAVLSDATALEAAPAGHSQEICVRSYPFPYRNAFALSNDCDSCSIEAFEDWHSFVNGSHATSYGDGLALEIGDSFWVWLGGSGGMAMSLGHADEPVREPAHINRIAELGRAGWFDTLHSLGNWRQDYKTFRHDLGTRNEVERSLELLDAKKMKPFVYVNHSYSPSNVAGPWGFYQKMDDPSHPMYAMDLMRKFGFRYFWTDYAVSNDKFGDQHVYGDDAEIRDAIARQRLWGLIYKRVSATENHIIDFAMNADDLRLLYLAMFNRTIVRVPAMDGIPMAAFKRYRGPWPADENSFHRQMSAENLNFLEEKRGAVVVYQHFGVTRDGPDGAKRRSTPPVLSAESVRAWRDIAERASTGRLFVTTTGRLLDYLCLAELLEFSLDKTAERWVVTLESLENSSQWSQRSETELLNGLSFVVPDDAPEVMILNAHGRMLDFKRAPDPMRPGKHAVYRPWQKLEWIPPTSNSASRSV